MKASRRYFIVILTIAIIILLIIIGSFQIKPYLRHFFGLDYKTKDEFCEIFQNNYLTFKNAAEILSNDYFDNIGYCSIGKKNNNSGKNIRLKKGIKIVIPTDVELDKNIKKEINDSNIWMILKKWDFDYIIVDPNGIFFVNRANLGFTVGILYCKLDLSKGVYRCKLEQISPNWYYCVSEWIWTFSSNCSLF